MFKGGGECYFLFWPQSILLLLCREGGENKLSFNCLDFLIQIFSWNILHCQAENDLNLKVEILSRFGEVLSKI